MPIEPDTKFLTLAQWLSPAFPTGAFAFSHGIEAAIHEGWITDAEGLKEWLRDCLNDGAGRTDAIFLRLAFDAPDPIALDAHARAFATSHERLREAELQGAAFVRAANAVWNLTLPDLLLPVALGHAARRADLDLDLCVGLYLQSMVTNLVSAALRLCPIGQTAGQRVVLDLQDDCLQLVRDTSGATLDDLCGNAFLSDIAAMRHETLEPRLFQS